MCEINWKTAYISEKEKNFLRSMYVTSGRIIQSQFLSLPCRTQVVPSKELTLGKNVFP